MASLMVHIHTGIENPNKVALGLLIAKTAATEGNDVTLFLAGDAVNVMRDEVLDSLQGMGLGTAREHFDAIVESGAQVYVSKMSSGARGVTEADLEGKNAQWGTPELLVKCTLDHDRVLTY
jgi:uncharacterized protein